MNRTGSAFLLVGEPSEYVVDYDAASEEFAGGFGGQLIPLVFGESQIESALDGFGFRLSAQRLLYLLELYGIKAEVLVGDAALGGGHGGFLNNTLARMFTKLRIVNIRAVESWRKLEAERGLALTLTLHLKPEVEAGLLARAQASGKVLEDYVLMLVEEAAFGASSPATEERSETAEAVERMIAFGEKHHLGLHEPMTRSLLHEDHRY